MATFQQFLASQGIALSGASVGLGGGFLTWGYTDAITAHAGGGQGSAYQLTTQLNTVTTVATAGDSVKLPTPTITNISPAGPQDNRGNMVIVNNQGANIMAVFPDTGGTINGGSANASINVAVGEVAIFYQTAALTWWSASDAGKIFSNVTLTGLLFESATDSITAHAGGGQASATALATEINRVTTVATLGDSVKLPASAAGLTIIVINHGANSMQVYGTGTDTVDDVATATGVSQMASSIVIYTCTTAGSWYTDGLSTGFVNGLQSLSFTAAVTAHAGGGQGSATALTSLINRISTVATQGDSVALPAAASGLSIVVLNRGANPMQVFGAGTDTINGIATATGISQGINTAATYVCNVSGNWEVPITSLQSTAPQALSAGSPALPPHVGHTYVITKGSVLAATIAAPTAGTDDGIEITLTSSTAFAHTLTATGLLQTGTASVNIATFAANAGAGVTLMAFSGKWIVICSVGITFS